jgi:ribokinase
MGTVDAKYIVLKLGERGCCVYDGKAYTYMEPFKVRAVDTTAAGDAFTAVLAVEYIKTGDIIRAARYANAAGALAATKHGAYTSLPFEGDVADLLLSHSFLVNE